jgi:hypothetical protein
MPRIFISVETSRGLEVFAWDWNPARHFSFLGAFGEPRERWDEDEVLKCQDRRADEGCDDRGRA